MNQLTNNATEAVEVTAGAGWRFSTRAVAALMLLPVSAALACHFIGDRTPATAALKVVASTLALAVVPGAYSRSCSGARARVCPCWRSWGSALPSASASFNYSRFSPSPFIPVRLSC